MFSRKDAKNAKEESLTDPQILSGDVKGFKIAECGKGDRVG
jgi:hypothetical protein